MSPPDPIHPTTQRLWSWALSALGLVIVATVTWSLLEPLLPVFVVIGLVVLGISGWNRRRWR